jgi:ABC-type antimicrobial peptide transport system permease subunit
MRGSGVPVYGRLRPGLDSETAARELTARLPAADRTRESRVWVTSLYDETTSGFGQTIAVLAGAVALIVLIACVNVGGLLLARGATRQPELAIRTSIGASRGRLVRQLLAESVVLGLLGGLLGLAVADQGTRLLLSLLPADLPRTGDVGIDATVLMFTLVVSLATGLLFGTAPAVMAARVEPLDALQSGGRSATTSGGRLRSALVGAEIAVALVVLSASSPKPS